MVELAIDKGNCPARDVISIQGALHSAGSAALIDDSTEEYRTCKRCGSKKQITEFYKRAERGDRARRCKECELANHKIQRTNYTLRHTAEFYNDVLGNVSRKKTCCSCNEDLHPSHFTKQKARSDGFASKCRVCEAKTRDPQRTRKNRLLREYGITLQNYKAMLKSQRGLCAICGSEPGKGKFLDVDHCHAGGHVRGLLCNRCNQAIGLLRDDATIVASALDYLLRI